MSWSNRIINIALFILEGYTNIIIISVALKKWAMLSVSRKHEHKGFKVSAKVCLKVCSFRWLKSTLWSINHNQIRSDLLNSPIFRRFNKTLYFFRKPTYESIFLIFGSCKFHSCIIYGKKEFLNIFVLRSSGWKKPWFRWGLCNGGNTL